MDLKGKRVLVFGSGKSGIGASRLLERKGAKVVLYDGNENLDRKRFGRRSEPAQEQRLYSESLQMK